MFSHFVYALLAGHAFVYWAHLAMCLNVRYTHATNYDDKLDCASDEVTRSYYVDNCCLLVHCVYLYITFVDSVAACTAVVVTIIVMHAAIFTVTVIVVTVTNATSNAV